MIDVLNLTPTQLARLVNAEEKLLTTAQLTRLRDTASGRLGIGGKMNLFAFAGFLLERRAARGWTTPSPSAPTTPASAAPVAPVTPAARATPPASFPRPSAPQAEPIPGGYSSHRDRAARKQAEQSLEGRDIGPIPPIVDLARRESCRYDLAKFIMTYSPEGMDDFSEDHIRAIKRIEYAVFHGGRFVEAVYRGFGKSTIGERASVWAASYGHKFYIGVYSANDDMAVDSLSSIKAVLESERYSEDFPDVSYPIKKLENITNRCRGQLCLGQPTYIKYGDDEIILPTVAGAYAADGTFIKSDSGGTVIIACSITSRNVRGPKRTRRKDNIVLRPDFAIIDDPQDDQSAVSPTQIKKRLNIITKAILKSAGHRHPMSVVMPCTVIAKGDLVDQLLDHEKFPAWQGERIPMIRKWADRHEDMWLGEYARLRNTYNPDDPADQERAHASATAFYESHRDEMDAGCIVSWKHCYAKEVGEVSAIQHAYNALIDDGEEVFASEYQNQPLAAEEESGQITAESLAAHLNRRKPGEVFAAADVLTMFIDVQQAALYWMVCAWKRDFSGAILEYGVFPEQGRRHFTVRQIQRTLARKFPGHGREAAWRAGLEELTALKLDRTYSRDDGAQLRIERCLIDANDGNARDTVFEFCRESKHPTVVMPSTGTAVRASGKPFAEYQKKPGDRCGLNWRVPARRNREAPYVFADVNWWKSFARARAVTPLGDPGSIGIYGSDPYAHQMLFEHLTSEYSIRTEGRGRSVDEWNIRLGHTENHWWDCLVGNHVAASLQGCEVAGAKGRTLGARKRTVDYGALAALGGSR